MILSLHTKHDANLTISSNKRILKYIEFEKITKKRYFSFSEDENVFKEQFKTIIIPEINSFIRHLKKINICWLTISQVKVVKEFLPNILIDETKKHHVMHAFSVYAFTNYRIGDLIISYDG